MNSPCAPTTVVLADRALLAHGVQALLDPCAEIDVIGIATDASDAFDTTSRLRPDVLVLGETLLGCHGADSLVARLRAGWPATRIVILAGADSGRTRAAVAAGAVGVVSTTSQTGELLAALQAVHRGTPLQPGPPAAPTRRAPPTIAHDLSPRETEVLRHLTNGTSTPAIAARLFLSPNTVRNHIQHILTKLGVHSRVAAATLALREGLVAED